MLSHSEHGARLAMKAQAEAEARDRRVKVWLLAVSILALVGLAAAVLQDGPFAAWRQHQLAYVKILEAKSTDDWGRQLAQEFRVQMRQTVAPELGVVDRCLSCHVGIDDPRMTDVPQPYTVHPGEYLKQHDPGEFGCTICHRGQGRALVFADAKGEEGSWQYPLLPASMTQSSCGLCHSSDEIRKAGGEKYALGKTLFESKGCYSCHKLARRGGSLGPALDAVGLKGRDELPMAHVSGPRTLPQWLVEHFRDPQKVVPDSQMKPPQLSREEVEALTIYMLSLQGRNLSDKYVSPSKRLEVYKLSAAGTMNGQELFESFCATCHDTGRYSVYDDFFKKYMPAVRGTSYVQTAPRQYVTDTIRYGHAKTLMPAWGLDAGGLTDDEISQIVTFLLGAPVGPQDALPPHVIARAMSATKGVSGNAARGKAVFERHCSACHGLDGSGALGPSLNNPILGKTATDGFIRATIAYGRRNTPMPGFLGAGGLADSIIDDLVAHVRSMSASDPGTPTSSETASLGTSGLREMTP